MVVVVAMEVVVVMVVAVVHLKGDHRDTTMKMII